MNVLFLCTLPRESPSVRPRVYGHLPALEAAGFRVEVAPFLGAAAFRRFYRPGLPGLAWKVAGSLAGAVRRLRMLPRLGEFDAVVIHREALPRGNRWLVERIRRRGIPLLYDLDDAIYLRPRDFVESGEDSRVAMTRGKDPLEVEFLMRQADLVMAGNGILGDHARSVGARSVEIVPTAVDTTRFRPRPSPAPAGDLPVVGWIGSPTATYCLRAIAPALTRAAREFPFRLLVIGASGAVTVPGVETEQRPWSLEREVEDHAGLDIGLYPLPDNPWTRGKCGYKALLYGACGVPTVASPVGVNATVIRDGETGFHAADDDQWTERILVLLRDAALRRRMGKAARELVLAQYSFDVVSRRVVDCLRRVTDGRAA